MSEDSLGLSWPGVLIYAARAVRRSWGPLLSGTAFIAVLAVLIPWGGVYGFTESGWDRVMGGNAVWSLLAIPAWLFLVAVWYLLRAPMGHAREVVAANGERLEGVNRSSQHRNTNWSALVPHLRCSEKPWYRNTSMDGLFASRTYLLAYGSPKMSLRAAR